MDREVATANTVMGCSASEIEEVEADVGRRLPLAYREFLARSAEEQESSTSAHTFFIRVSSASQRPPANWLPRIRLASFSPKMRSRS